MTVLAGVFKVFGEAGNDKNTLCSHPAWVLHDGCTLLLVVGPTFWHSPRHSGNSDAIVMRVCVCVCVCALTEYDFQPYQVLQASRSTM